MRCSKIHFVVVASQLIILLAIAIVSIAILPVATTTTTTSAAFYPSSCKKCGRRREREAAAFMTRPSPLETTERSGRTGVSSTFVGDDNGVKNKTTRPASSMSAARPSLERTTLRMALRDDGDHAPFFSAAASSAAAASEDTLAKDAEAMMLPSPPPPSSIADDASSADKAAPSPSSASLIAAEEETGEPNESARSEKEEQEQKLEESSSVFRYYDESIYEAYAATMEEVLQSSLKKERVEHAKEIAALKRTMEANDNSGAGKERRWKVKGERWRRRGEEGGGRDSEQGQIFLPIDKGEWDELADSALNAALEGVECRFSSARTEQKENAELWRVV